MQSRGAAFALLLALLLFSPASRVSDTLAVRIDGGWREWWRADRAPASGASRKWTAWRSVPLGLVILPRAAVSAVR